MHAIAGVIAFAIAAFAGAQAHAQTYPSRAINMVVPFPAGGNTDIMARALQAEMSKAMGQTIVIINKGGAAGTLGLIDVARAAPDGYTIALSPNNPITAQPHLQKLPYSMDSFRYVCLTYYAPYVLIAGPKAPFKTFDAFVKFAKAKPENLVYGHPGLASQPQLGMLAVLKAIGADGLGVPFTGAGPMAQAMLAGTVMAMSESTAVAKASNLNVLAVQTAERIPALPNVPTMKELGFPSEAFSAGGLIVPAATPDAVVARLEKACADAVASEAYKATTEKLNATARFLSGKDFRKMFDADSVANAEAVKKAGIK
jgi:tripartite-type tricarboxylate transporter receptor subunit TctC